MPLANKRGVTGQKVVKSQTRRMDAIRLGAVFRAVRIRKRWRQVDVAAAAGVSQATVSRIERGHLRLLSVDAILRVAEALEIRIDWSPRWRGGDLDRMLNA